MRNVKHVEVVRVQSVKKEGKMEKPMTTTYLNVKGRADFLKQMTERLNCGDIEGQILTEAERFAYAVCEEIDKLRKGRK